ncbi:hypothetical protein N7495_003194 [Penicillium taxi]|uniref:uncharacterized protein n=1 Tax=Penicillium taxi TaxID=168475 RepID=UPI002545AC60|nr:uncharacterized protein N7495_003194 [Penicillium taxi]KAJ5902666.1 hypothetical protein N7495_003194 [Penicillium taxi]
MANNQGLLPSQFIVNPNLARRRESEWSKPYPKLVLELSSRELQRLAGVFHLDNTICQGRNIPRIRRLVEALPNRLRCGRIRRLTTRLKSPLCQLHKTINPYLVDQYTGLIQSEVTTKLKHMDAFPDIVSAVEAEVLKDVRAIRGMWLKPGSSDLSPGAWEYQINLCGGCQLARIASNKDLLRDLRTVVLSRGRTHINPGVRDRQYSRTARLTPFLNECIYQFGDPVAEELLLTGAIMAEHMKETRKKCVIAWRLDPSRPHRHKYKPRSSNAPATRPEDNPSSSREQRVSQEREYRTSRNDPRKSPSNSREPKASREHESRKSRRLGPSTTRSIGTLTTEEQRTSTQNLYQVFKRLSLEQQRAEMEKVFEGLQRPTLKEQMSVVHKFFKGLEQRGGGKEVYESLRQGTLEEQMRHMYRFFQDLEYDIPSSSYSQDELVPVPLRTLETSRAGNQDGQNDETESVNPEVEEYLEQLRRQSNASIGDWTDNEHEIEELSKVSE